MSYLRIVAIYGGMSTLNLVMYFLHAHLPFNMFAAGVCFGLGVAAVINELVWHKA